MRPQGTLSPATLEELREVVAAALADEVPLEVKGAGTKAGFGRPVEAEAVLSTARLKGVDLYEPEELVMSAGAATPVAEIEGMLAERGQELAFEPVDQGWLHGGEAGRQTIGGVFACNLAGPRRVKAGAARDHILGVTCVTGRGEAIKAGGRVVKNVTGYDVPKLLVGSHGTLAVMSRLTFKVLPRPETTATLLLRGLPDRALLGRLRLAVGSSHEASGAALLPALAAGRSALEAVRLRGASVAAIRLEGPGPSVAWRLDALSAELATDGLRLERLENAASKALWAEIRDVRLLARGCPLWRLSLPPAAADELEAWLAEIAPERLYDWAGGLVWVALRPDQGPVRVDIAAEAAATIRRAFEGRGGHATLVRAPEAVRAEVPVFEPQPPALHALSRRVKESFDPKRILNRGRMHPDL